MSINFDTHASAQIIFVGRDGRLKVKDYTEVHGAGTVNVTVVGNDGSNLLSLNLSAEKARELHAALGALIAPSPVTAQTWADLQVVLVIS